MVAKAQRISKLGHFVFKVQKCSKSNVWDTPGAKAYRCFEALQKIKPDIVIMMYSIDNLESFNEVSEFIYIAKDDFSMKLEK